MPIFDSFLLFWPNSSISYDKATTILDGWKAEYEVRRISIPDNVDFFIELYGISSKLAKNKLRVCGSGQAVLLLYKSPVDIIRYRATFSEIKLCNTFSFDLKSVMRALDGANRIHGSTDFEEFRTDIAILESVTQSNISNSKSKPRLLNSHLSLQRPLSATRRLLNRINARFKYGAQLCNRNFDYYTCYISLVLEKKTIRPHLRTKWRWGSRYFTDKHIGDCKFIKTPNKFEDYCNEIDLVARLKKKDLVPSEAKLIKLLGRNSLKFDFIDVNSPSTSYLTSDEGINELTDVLSELQDCNIAHRDLKADNFHLASNGKLQLIDLGLGCDLNSKEKVKGREKIGAPKPRWNDGIDVMNILFKVDGMNLLLDKDLYKTLASVSGAYALIGDKLYVP